MKTGPKREQALRDGVRVGNYLENHLVPTGQAVPDDIAAIAKKYGVGEFDSPPYNSDVEAWAGEISSAIRRYLCS